MKYYLLTTFKDSFNAFLKNNALYLALGVVALIIIAIMIILIKLAYSSPF